MFPFQCLNTTKANEQQSVNFFTWGILQTGEPHREASVSSRHSREKFRVATLEGKIHRLTRKIAIYIG
jgi:hypothetical protein